jgi:predicted TIM-barrel fold metal-dependent hydrolase
MSDALPAQAAPKLPEHNLLGLDYRRPIPRPKVRGPVIDAHIHLSAARHGKLWFEAADHYGLDCFLTMTPLEEALSLYRDWPHRLSFIVIPKWHDWGPGFIDNWLRRIEAFYNIGSRIVKFWFAPPAWGDRGWRLDSAMFRSLFKEAVARRMAIMTHIGDPDAWYRTRYGDSARYGTRLDHYRMWENVMGEWGRDVPWLAAHMAGHPEDLGHLQRLLDRWPRLRMDCSATKWVLRELCAQRDAARDFFIRNQDRILFGTDLVTADGRDFDFLASRFWAHRKLWETARIGPSPICDPEAPADAQPQMRGLALPDEVLQKLYHDNAAKMLAEVGAGFAGWD